MPELGEGEYTGEHQEGASDSNDYEELKAPNKPHGRNFVQCTAYTPTPLNGKRITISARDGAQKAGGLFSSSYLHYKIYTEPVGFVVTRKDEEFYKLRKHLRKHYPYVLIPPLPVIKKKNTEKSIKRRQRFFSRFLQAVCRSEILKSCPYLVDWLKNDDIKEFAKV